MKVNELEAKLQIDRANIRFYEKEGLLRPERGENGYREYSEEDMITLKKIIIFRKLGFSITEIRGILNETLDLASAIEKNMEQLNKQIHELNGALEVCKVMSKESMSSFDEDYYWIMISEKESMGQKFVDFVKDYMTFEKNVLIQMYGNLTYDDEGNEKKHGIWIAIGTLFVACILRGLWVQFGMKTGTFGEGFVYPFLLFLFLSVCSMPVFILQRKYRDYQPQETVKQRKTWQKVGIIAGFFVLMIGLAIGLPILVEVVVFTNLIGSQNPFVMTTDSYILYIVVVFALFLLLVFLYSDFSIYHFVRNGKSAKNNLPPKVKRKAVGYGFLVLLIVLVIYCTWFDLFTAEGAVKQRLFYHKEYTWDDVDYYTLENGTDGIMEYVVVMEDGSRLVCFGDGVSSSNLSKEVGIEDEGSFCYYLTELFAEKGIKLRVEDWDGFYQELDYKYWQDMADKIKQLAE